MPYFWIGAIMADLRHNGQRSYFGGKIWGFPFLGWAVLIVLSVASLPIEHHVAQIICQLICLAALLKISFVSGNSFHWVLANPFFAWTGLACYSIYLVHLQILQVLIPAIVRGTGRWSFGSVVAISFGIAIPVILIVTWGFYRLLERPFSHAATRISRRYFPDKAGAALAVTPSIPG
jgi:peptidoglycan/LPS O-acetylase OafA/YrhL